MSSKRSYHTASLSTNGKVLVVGGYTLDDGYLNSSEFYDPSTGTWTTTSNMHIERYHHTSSVLPDGEVLVAGGFRHGSWINSSELYNPSTGNWTITGRHAPKPKLVLKFWF